MRKFLISLFLALAIFAYPLAALAEEGNVTLMVDGLSCPFCVYGLEKKIKKIEGVESLEIDLKSGKVDIKFIDRKGLEVKKIEEAVRDAGFTPRAIKVQEVAK